MLLPFYSLLLYFSYELKLVQNAILLTQATLALGILLTNAGYLEFGLNDKTMWTGVPSSTKDYLSWIP
nr:unnamed protein product [Callosobruchus chinensis]